MPTYPAVALDGFAGLPAGKTPIAALGAALRAWAAEAVPDAAAVEAALGKLPPEFRGDGEFCFGWYLHNRNQPDRAALWKRSLASPGTPWVKAHAPAGLAGLNRKKD